MLRDPLRNGGMMLLREMDMTKTHAAESLRRGLKRRFVESEGEGEFGSFRCEVIEE